MTTELVTELVKMLVSLSLVSFAMCELTILANRFAKV